MSANYYIYPTKNTTFTPEDHAALLRLMHKRFGGRWESTHLAWKRMLENDCTYHDFMRMVKDLLGETSVGDK